MLLCYNRIKNLGSLIMPKKSLGRNSESAPSKGADSIDIAPEVLVKLLSPGYHANQLKDVEEIVISELPLISPHDYSKGKRSRRGPKSPEDWVSEIRKCWRNLDDVDKLARSWLAFSPQIQRIAVSKYGGGIDGRGKALKELLTQALSEAKQYNTDEKTHAILSKYPDVNKTKIADEFDMSREQFSRGYVSKANKILTKAFLDILHHRSKA